LERRTPRAATLDFIGPYGEILGCLTDVGFAARGSQTGGPYAVWFLIDDLDVLPRRPNWQAVLDRHAAV
jgi:hypothetical protein